MKFNIDANMNVLQKDVIPEIGSILFEVDTSARILDVKLLIGYANSSKKIATIESYFNNVVTLTDNILYEAVEDFTSCAAYVVLTSIAIDNLSSMDKKASVKLKDFLMHEDADIQYITYCFNDFLNGNVRNSQIKVNWDFLDRTGLKYFFMTDSHLKQEDIKVFVQKAIMMSFLSKSYVYLSKSDIIKDFEKAYFKRKKVLMSKTAVVKHDLNVNEPVTEFEPYYVYFRQSQNGTIYTYAYLGKCTDGKDYFLSLIKDKNKEYVITKLIEMEKMQTWMVGHIKKSDIKTLNIKLYATHIYCNFLNHNSENLTDLQRVQLKELEQKWKY